MELPNELKLAIERQTVGVPQSMLRTAAENISIKYRNETGTGKRLLSTEIDILVYAIVRMPGTYGAVSSALNYSLEINNPGFKTVLDVGAGMGTATWAVESTIDTVEKITCIEREPAMISFGKTLMKDTPSLLAKTEWINCDMRDLRFPQKYDLVVASYALGELSDMDREKVIEKLWSITSKLLLIVEPGNPLAFYNLRTARAQLINADAFVVAPCPHSDNCLLPDDDWCHFTCRISRSRLHKQLKGGDIPYKDEKFTYLAVARDSIQTNNSRILHHPLIESGRIMLKLCTPNGIETKSVTKKQKDSFEVASKAKCGDTF